MITQLNVNAIPDSGITSSKLGNISLSEWSDTPSNNNIPSEKLVYDTITENEEITSAAINDLNTRLSALEQSLLELTNQILN